MIGIKDRLGEAPQDMAHEAQGDSAKQHPPQRLGQERGEGPFWRSLGSGAQKSNAAQYGIDDASCSVSQPREAFEIVAHLTLQTTRVATSRPLRRSA